MNNNYSTAAGQGIWDTTSLKQIGYVASISGTTGVTLTANAAYAVASGDTIMFYSPSQISTLQSFNRQGQNATSAIYPAQNWPGNPAFYPKAGNLISDSNATPCLPAGETIASVDQTPTDATFGNITLTSPSVYDCPAFTNFTVRPTDTQVQALSKDWVALESASYAAGNQNNPDPQATLGNTKNMRTVVLPDGAIQIERPWFFYDYLPIIGQHLAIHGSGTSTIAAYGDFGPNKCAISEGQGAVNNAGNHVYFKDFNLVGPGATGSSPSGASGNAGNNPSGDYGLCLSSGDVADNIIAQGFHAGFGLFGDHQKIFNSTASSNFYAVYFMPGEQSNGNQAFENDSFLGNFQASFGLAASSQFDSGTVFETHIGNSPYGWVQEPSGIFDPYSSNFAFITNSTLMDNWWEATAQGVFYAPTNPYSSFTQDTFIGAQNGNDTNEGGPTYNTTAIAVVNIGGVFTNNKFLGGNMLSDYSLLSAAAIKVAGTCSGNTFIGLDTIAAAGAGFITGSSATKPAMICGSDGGGNTFTGQFKGTLHLAGQATIYPGQSVTLNSSLQVVPYNGSNGYLGDAMTGGSNSIAGEMIPIVTSGDQVVVQDNAATNSPALTPGEPIVPTSNGYYGGDSTGAWNTGVGIMENATNTSHGTQTPSGGLGYANLR